MTLARANLGISWVGSSSWNDVFCSKPLSVFELFCTYRLCQGLHETLILLLILSLLSHNCIGCPRVFWMMRKGNIHSFPCIYSHHFRHYRSASFLPHLLPVISHPELSVIISLVSVVVGALYTGVVQGLQGRCSLGMSCSLSCAKQGTWWSWSSPPAFLCKPDLRVDRRDSVKKLPDQSPRYGNHF